MGPTRRFPSAELCECNRRSLGSRSLQCGGTGPATGVSEYGEAQQTTAGPHYEGTSTWRTPSRSKAILDASRVPNPLCFWWSPSPYPLGRPPRLSTLSFANSPCVARSREVVEHGRGQLSAPCGGTGSPSSTRSGRRVPHNPGELTARCCNDNVTPA